MDERFYCGIDIGSVAVKLVLLSAERNIQESFYRRSHGQSWQALQDIISELSQKYPDLELAGMATTGSGGKHLAQLLGCDFVNEIVALAKTADFARDEAKARYDAQIAELRAKRTDAMKRLRTLRDASDNAWRALRQGLDAAVEELGAATSQVLSESETEQGRGT